MTSTASDPVPRGEAPPVPGVPTLVLREVTAGAVADSSLHLLARDHRAIPPPGSGGGRVFVLVDLAAPPEDGPAAAALVVDLGGGTVELRALAVSPRWPAALVAPRLLTNLADLLRRAGDRRLVVGVGTTDRMLLHHLPAAGFCPTATNVASPVVELGPRASEGNAEPSAQAGPWLELVL